MRRTASLKRHSLAAGHPATDYRLLEGPASELFGDVIRRRALPKATMRTCVRSSS